MRFGAELNTTGAGSTNSWQSLRVGQIFSIPGTLLTISRAGRAAKTALGHHSNYSLGAIVLWGSTMSHQFRIACLLVGLAVSAVGCCGFDCGGGCYTGCSTCCYEPSCGCEAGCVEPSCGVVSSGCGPVCGRGPVCECGPSCGCEGPCSCEPSCGIADCGGCEPSCGIASCGCEPSCGCDSCGGGCCGCGGGGYCGNGGYGGWGPFGLHYWHGWGPDWGALKAGWVECGPLLGPLFGWARGCGCGWGCGNNGCGDLYFDEWLCDPPACCDPCCNSSCGSCASTCVGAKVRTGLTHHFAKRKQKWINSGVLCDTDRCRTHSTHASGCNCGHCGNEGYATNQAPRRHPKPTRRPTHPSDSVGSVIQAAFSR